MHRIVGLDLAGDTVRLVLLESGFRGFSVQEFAQAALPAEGTLAERLAQGLGALGAARPVTGDAIAVTLPGAQIASFPMSLPFTDLRRIEQVLPAEVEGAIPFDLDDVVWDYAVLSQQEGKSELLVAVVRKQALKETIDALAAAGIDPKVITFGPLALAALGEKKLLAGPLSAPRSDKTDPAIDIASLARGEPQPPPPQDGAQVEAILEAGPDRAEFCVLQNGKPELARSLPAVGKPAWDAAAADPEALQRLFGPLVRDLKITLRGRAGKKAQPPSRLLLAGALATLPGARDRLAAELGLPCEPLSLAAGTPLPPAAQALDFEASAYALALGLALRAQHPRGHVNFRKGEHAFTKDVSQARGVLLKLGGAFATVLALALLLGVARVSALNRQAKAYDDALCEATQRILKKCHTDWREALGALRGADSKAASVPRVGATEILAEVTQHLPEDALPALEDVEITTTRVTLKGTADGLSQVDRITAALKKDRCFGEIKQPNVQRVANTQKYTFTIDFAYTCAEAAGGA